MRALLLVLLVTKVSLAKECGPTGDPACHNVEVESICAVGNKAGVCAPKSWKGNTATCACVESKSQPKETPAPSKSGRRCTAAGTAHSCENLEVMHRCFEGDQVGVCAPKAWFEEAAQCVCASFPAKKIDKAVRKAIDNIMGRPPQEKP